MIGHTAPRVGSAILAVLLLCLPAAAGWSQLDEPRPTPPSLQPTRTLGDQVLQISVGPFIPLFFQSVTGKPAILATGLTLGGTGSLQWNAYVSKSVRIGAEVAGMFAFSRRQNTLLMVPIMAKATYALTAYPFEFPFSIAVGMNIVKYVEEAYVDPIVRPGIGAYWQFDVTWSFGLNLYYWWVPHISLTSADDTRFGNFMEITISALYNF